MPMRTSPPTMPAFFPERLGIRLPSIAPRKLMTKVVQPISRQLGTSRTSS